MIALGSYSFRYAVAAGALGFDGRGYLWERPFYWLGLIDPRKMLVITKTLTLHARPGHYCWWKPWQTFRLVEGGAVNALGMPNPGLDAWFHRYYPKTVAPLYSPFFHTNIAISIAPDDGREASHMAMRIAAGNLGNIRAIELNCSCPNLGHSPSVDEIVAMAHATAEVGLPVIVKLGYQQPFLPVCRALDGQVAAFDLINTVPWSHLSSKPSPLAKYGREGGVSGEQIAWHAIEALRMVKEAGLRTPVLSGGGILTYEDAVLRLRLADAISFGSIYIRTPWRARNIIERIERGD